MRTAIVTGASRGFGLALARELAEDDWNLVIDARHRSELIHAAEGLDEKGHGTILALDGDVSDAGHLEQLVDASDRLGGLDLLVNNAGSLGPSPLPRLSAYPVRELLDVFRVNVVAPLRLIQMALPSLRDRRGTIVNITSDAAVEAYEGWGGYGSSKAALEQVSNVIAVEEDSVRVMWFDPGDMATKMQQDAYPGEDISDRSNPETRVPALIRLLESDAASGRYTAEEILARQVSA
jgi:NAD(P)-dependent dehydrogenase (short-subunit alcohol dehydrogenase family)